MPITDKMACQPICGLVILRYSWMQSTGWKPEPSLLNKGIVGYVNGYHNGHKLSGLGGEDGTHGLEGYMQKRTVYMAY